jgi:phosphate-selective porin OprO/OprP
MDGNMAGRVLLSLVLCTGLLGGAVDAHAEDDPTTLRLYWKDGLRMETSDKQFKFKIGGRIMNDWAFFDVDDQIKTATGDDHDNGTEFRRARLYIAGEIYKTVIFKDQYNLAGGDADFKDVYVGLKNLGPVGTARVGHFKESVGLEELTSSKYITFMERSLTSALVPGRNTGFGLNNTCADDRMTWAVGVFYDSDDFGDSTGDNVNFSTRVTGTPLVEDDALVHLGFSFRHGSPENSALRLRQRPSTHMAARWVDTQDAGVDMAIDTTDTFGGELSAVVGPASFQAEYFHMLTDSKGGAAVNDPDFRAYYIMGSVFVTGESRNYNAKHGTFSRVKPHANFGSGNGPGAIELALRFSAIDLTDSGAEGGEMWDITTGVNWHLNPNTRVMLNYVHAEVEDRLTGAGGGIDDSDGDIVQVRFQLDF